MSAIKPGPTVSLKEDLIRFLYNYTDIIIIPINNLLYKAGSLLPQTVNRYLPYFRHEESGSILEWSVLLVIPVILLAGILIEHIFKLLGEYETAFLKIVNNAPAFRETVKENGSNQKESTGNDRILKEKEAQLKSAYNLIIRRLDREKTELVNKNISLEKSLIVDPLTNLKNRKYLDERLMHDFNTAKCRKKELSVIMIDIDNFKHINDQYGHHTGDMVLKDISAIIQNICPANIVCARYGGEEITLLCLNFDANKAYQLAETIRKEVQNRLQYPQNICSKITISAGVATYTSQSKINNAHDLIKKADEALYKAKESGKNNVKCFSH
jgi:diguanylate cyclase (GGDEF)-like protein